MPREPLYVEDILAALREGRIGSETAHRWIEIRLDNRARDVRAQAAPAMADEFEGLFPPSSPLGPEVSLGAERGQRNWQPQQGFATPQYPRSTAYSSAEPATPREMDIRPGTPMYSAAAAAPLTDDEVYDALFPPDYQGASGWEAG